jgi:metallo-beta-lactamase family protein
MQITFCGAAESVTGSCHLVETAGEPEIRFLLDCGQFQGGAKQEAKNYEPFPFDPAQIDFLVLSHAHIDHCGRIPLLVKQGFTGRIYCTDSTADL